eukprot:6043735-Karenia_brevis.AAC.1
MKSFRVHLQEHVSGRLMGDVPAPALEQLDLDVCNICSKLLARRFGGTCPRCRPQLGEQNMQVDTGRPIPAGYPAIKEVFHANIPTRKHVPKGARSMWSECLTKCVNQINVHNDMLAWVEFYMLAKSVLRAAGQRAGRKHKKQSERDTRSRCKDWLNGNRLKLWQEAKHAAGKQKGR